MKKSTILFGMSLVLWPFGHATQAQERPQGNEPAAIEIPDSDSAFVAKYSKLFGFSVDSCSNKKLIAAAAAWLGAPYRAGGMTKAGTDCSGFVSSLYKEVFDIHLQHGGATMLHQMKQIVRKGLPLKEGDILFFRHGRRITHVGMYLKDFKFIHAATRTRGVVVDDLRTPYFRRFFFLAGRPFPKQEVVVF
jgi:lipoprotein Spr/probable lipoprotein NlpC